MTTSSVYAAFFWATNSKNLYQKHKQNCFQQVTMSSFA
jgi:hypothetical protein